MTDNSIVERIQKLLSLALNNSNPAEAAVAMSKAKELMLKHAVEDFQLHGKEAAEDTAVYIVSLGRYFEGWMKIVQASIAKLYDAKVYISTRAGSDVATFVCSASDYDALQASYKFCVASILRESAKITKGRATAKSFRNGAAEGLSIAISSAKYVPTDEQTTALVHLRNAAVLAKGAELFPHVRSSTVKLRADDYDAYMAGKQFGGSMQTSDSKKLDG